MQGGLFKSEMEYKQDLGRMKKVATQFPVLNQNVGIINIRT